MKFSVGWRKCKMFSSGKLFYWKICFMFANIFPLEIISGENEMICFI